MKTGLTDAGHIQSRYREIASGLRAAIGSDAWAPGERLPSARRLAEREGVSLATAVEALRLLESEGLLVARPRSGYFRAARDLAETTPSTPRAEAGLVSMSEVARGLFVANTSGHVPLGAALPDPTWLPVAALNRSLASAARRLGPAGQAYSLPPGRADLRRQIALRAAVWGARFGPDDIVVTSGETQAMRLALRATCRPGDIVAIESPTYFGVLMLLETLGLRALEIATHPRTGLDLAALERALATQLVAALVASPVVQNPLGATMPHAARKALVALLKRHGTVLIEDDIYGDLIAPGAARTPCKAFDREGDVLYCSSVSKTLAPGWRVGWLAAGRHHDAVMKLRLAESLAGAPVIEAALADYLAGGDYERHLRRLRPRIESALRAVVTRVNANLDGARLAYPSAGYLLWVELPVNIDALELHARAGRAGISISPGHLFAPGPSYDHHIRINCANEATPQLLGAIDRLGALLRSY